VCIPVIEIFEKPGPAPGFDLLTWAESWACSPGKTQAQEKPRKVKNAWAWTLGTGKTPGLVPEPARSLVVFTLTPKI